MSEAIFTGDVQLSNAQSVSLICGYTRSFFKKRLLPFDIAQLCVSFYSIWFDLKVVLADEETGDIDTTEYQTFPVSLDTTLEDIAALFEDAMFKEFIQNECAKLCQLSTEELLGQVDSISTDKASARAVLRDYGKREVAKIIIATRYGMYTNDQFNKCSWKFQKADPLVHLWLKFKHIKSIYPININTVVSGTITLYDELYKDEDGDRMVEVPDDFLKGLTMRDIRKVVKGFDCLVVEQRNYVANAIDQSLVGAITGMRKWSRQQGDDWRETLQVGDIVEVRDGYGKDFESVVRYIYPNDHETMSGKCVIHYIGWETKWDETLDINSNRIMKRYTHCNGPFRKGRKRESLLFEHFESVTTHIEDPASKPSNSICSEPVPSSNLPLEIEQDCPDPEVAKLVSVHKMETYASQKYARNHKAKLTYSKKKKLRKRFKESGAKSGVKKIANKMKKYKVHYEC